MLVVTNPGNSGRFQFLKGKDFAGDKPRRRPCLFSSVGVSNFHTKSWINFREHVLNFGPGKFPAPSSQLVPFIPSVLMTCNIIQTHVFGAEMSPQLIPINLRRSWCLPSHLEGTHPLVEVIFGYTTEYCWLIDVWIVGRSYWYSKHFSSFNTLIELHNNYFGTQL